MGVVAILVMWPRPHKQTFVPPTHGGSTWNLALIGQVGLEEKVFENGGRTDGPYYKLTNEPTGSGELKIVRFTVNPWSKAVILDLQPLYTAPAPSTA